MRPLKQTIATDPDRAIWLKIREEAERAHRMGAWHGIVQPMMAGESWERDTIDQIEEDIA